MASTLFRDVRVFDGSGSGSFRGDVLVDGTEIAAVQPGGCDVDASTTVVTRPDAT